MQDFTSKLNDPSTSGAVFFAVCRGKVTKFWDVIVYRAGAIRFSHRTMFFIVVVVYNLLPLYIASTLNLLHFLADTLTWNFEKDSPKIIEKERIQI